MQGILVTIAVLAVVVFAVVLAGLGYFTFGSDDEDRVG
jgi:flagellar basal body-associated protein FliL